MFLIKPTSFADKRDKGLVPLTVTKHPTWNRFWMDRWKEKKTLLGYVAFNLEMIYPKRPDSWIKFKIILSTFLLMSSGKSLLPYNKYCTRTWFGRVLMLTNGCNNSAVHSRAKQWTKKAYLNLRLTAGNLPPPKIGMFDPTSIVISSNVQRTSRWKVGYLK